MLRTILYFLTMLLFCGSSFAYDFKGDNLGEITLEQFKAKYRRLAAKGQYAPVCTDESPEAAGIKTPSNRLVNCSLDYPFERRQSGGYKPPTVGGVSVLADTTHPGIVYRFVEGRLWRVEVEIVEDSYPQLRLAALAKYGESPNRTEETVELRGGGTRHSELLHWESGGDVAELRQVQGMAGVSALILYNRALEEKAQAILKAEAGKAAADM